MKNKIFKEYLIFVLIILAGLFGGGIGVFGKIALKEIPSFSFTFIRFSFASIFLLPILLRSHLKIDKSILKIIALSLLASANVILFSFGIKHTSASIGQMIYTASPLLTALLSFFLLKEKFSRAKTLGLIIGFIGTLIIVLIPLFENNFKVNSQMSGNLIILTAMISFTLYSVISKKLTIDYKPIQITSIFAFTTFCLTGLLSLYDLKNSPEWWQEVSLKAIVSVAYVGILGTALYYLLMQIIIKKASPVISNLILYLQPIATIILSITFLDESLSLIFLAGSALSLVGVWKTTRSK